MMPMFTAVLGTPSPIAHWTLHVVRTAMEILDGEHALIHSDTLEEFRSERHRLHAGAKGTVLFATAPAATLGNLLARAKAPIIAANDTAPDVVSFAVGALGMSTEIAMREYLKSKATQNSVLHAPSSIQVSSAAYALPFRVYLEDLTRCCPLDIDRALLDAITTAVVGQHPAGDSAPVGDLIVRDIKGAEKPGQYSVLDADSLALVDRLGSQFESILAGDRQSNLRCPQTLYIADGAIYGLADRWRPLLGPKRCFLWGPYIHLPKGQWFVRARIAVRENRSGNKLRVEVLRAISLHRAIEALLPAEGVFEFEMEFEVVEPRDPIEVTFTILEGAIEGAFRLVDIGFHRQF